MITLAQYWSTHFAFSAVGSSPSEALAGIKSALAKHAEQYSLDPDWYREDDISIIDMAIGAGYRDNERIV